MDEGQRRYVAFLSYNHKDAAAARVLHRRLESYRIPRRLVGGEGERGSVPARLTPVFRDREELPAAGDLSQRVRTALAVSDTLVILCSPAAAASPWVAKEIETFRALHPDRPIIAAILDGEPAEAFPPSLCAGGIEPLAADLRPGRDGRRLGFLKLVAGLSGVGLDALVQRDAQRRLRRVTAVTGVALAAVVAMAVLTAVALQARAEAQRQRAEAEGLVEFMLTDLRDRLKGVGRLDVLQAVNDRALRHYGRDEPMDSLSDDSLMRRARILHAIGEDYLEGDELPAAMQAFQEASAVMQVQLRRHPGDLSRVLEEGRNQFGVGRVHELRKQWVPAAAAYRKFAEAAERVAVGHPTADNMGEAASAAIDVGNVEYGQGRYGAALAAYRRAVRLLARASRARPDDLHVLQDLGKALAWMGSTYYKQGNWDAAVRFRRLQKQTLLRARAVDLRNAEVSYGIAVADRGLGCALLQDPGPAAALPPFREATEIIDGLLAIDGDNPQWVSLRNGLRDDLRGTVNASRRARGRKSGHDHGSATPRDDTLNACESLQSMRERGKRHAQ